MVLRKSPPDNLAAETALGAEIEALPKASSFLENTSDVDRANRYRHRAVVSTECNRKAECVVR